MIRPSPPSHRRGPTRNGHIPGIQVIWSRGEAAERVDAPPCTRGDAKLQVPTGAANEISGMLMNILPMADAFQDT
jgi:hypothetical protein